jgi:hypothetical protein
VPLQGRFRHQSKKRYFWYFLSSSDIFWHMLCSQMLASVNNGWHALARKHVCYYQGIKKCRLGEGCKLRISLNHMNKK